MGLLTLLPRSIKGLKMISLVIFTVTLVVLTRETTLIQNKVRTVLSTSPGLRSSGKSVQAVRKRVFLCGYRLTQFVDAVFPDYEVIDEYDPAKGSIVSDILAIGMHSDCAFAKNFNGVVFYLNGESTTTEVADDSYFGSRKLTKTKRNATVLCFICIARHPKCDTNVSRKAKRFWRKLFTICF